MKDKKLSFNIGIAGELPENADKNAYKDRLRSLFHVIEDELKGTKSEISFVTNSRIYNEFWQDFVCECNCSVIVTDACFQNTDTARSGDIRISTIRNTTDIMDLMLMVWDENTENQGGIPWEFLQISHKKEIPCIWLSASDGKIYWAEQVYYGKYSRDNLTKYIQKIFSRENYETVKEKKIRFMKIGAFLYGRFLKKFNAQNVEIMSDSDHVMDDEYTYSNKNEERNSLRLALRKKFNEYDGKAIKYSEKYAASIYLRSILPLISTIFIGTGFYIEAVGGFLFDMKIADFSIWSLMAAVGFTLYLFINAFVYILSKNPTVNLWHSRFIKNRITAEMLRVMIHFLPSGISVDISSALGSYGSMTDQEKSAKQDLHRILRSLPVCQADFTISGKQEILKNARSLIDDQIFYLRKTKKRYASIIKHLKKWGAVMFSVSSVIIIIRTLFQLLYTLGVMNFMGEYSLPFGTNVNSLSFTTSMLNTLALLLPAWGGFFTSKLQLCNFENMYNAYDAKEEQLNYMRVRVAELLRRSDVPVNTIYDTADELTVILLSETKTWGKAVKQNRFTKL